MNLSYNTEKSKLILSEYGRNVQQLIEYAVVIEDDTKREALVKGIINLMGQMNPAFRNVEDFKHKLWDHLFIISDFKLKAKSPYPVPGREEVQLKAIHIGYPKSKIKYKHYGKNVETLIEKACKMEDPEKKQGFALCIANYMKLVYKNWNEENVNNELIINDLATLSESDLLLSVEDSNLDKLNKPSRLHSKKRPGQSKGYVKKSGRHSTNNRRRQKNRR
ncbi:MAG TPA: DUF4290 domain-containing protein [Flavobacteriales bacterium]|nr:DUF4290 domain-containing protein [Flavobacteriales bacterium]